MTQLAAFDSPVATFLDEEVRAFKNYPMTCQSLQSLATFLRFDWNAPHEFREVFKARLFDYVGKLDIGGDERVVHEAGPVRQFAAAGVRLRRLGPVAARRRPARADEWADYRGVTVDLLRAFQVRRLEAMEHVAASLDGNPHTVKTPFVLPDLAGSRTRPTTWPRPCTSSSSSSGSCRWTSGRASGTPRPNAVC